MSTRHHASVVVHGRTIAYSTVGDGPPLMLIPGICQSSERWVDAGYVDALASAFTLILIDPLGHGESEKVTDRSAYGRDELTAHIVGVVDDLGFDRIAAWGYSRGAQMLGSATLSHPDRFSHAILGGIPLFDAEAALQALGLARDEAEYDEAFAKASQGDWEAYWSVFPLPLPDATKQHLQGMNDVRAISAAAWAARSINFIYEPAPVSSFAIWGEGEIFHDLNLEAIEGFGDRAPQWGTVAGGHAQAFFNERESMVEQVRAFLTSGS